MFDPFVEFNKKIFFCLSKLVNLCYGYGYGYGYGYNYWYGLSINTPIKVIKIQVLS